MGISKAKIYYFTLQDEPTKEEKLEWLEQTRQPLCPRGTLDQYKEKKPRDPTIHELFNIYHFADSSTAWYNGQSICYVSFAFVY